MYQLLSKSFIYQQKHFISVLENIKIYIEIYIKIAVFCAEFHSAQHTAHTPPWTWYNMLQYDRIIHNDVVLPI
jgi:hypothetical protein